MKFHLTTEQVDRLDKRQLSAKEMLLLRLRTQLTLEQIADLVGVSKQRVSVIINDALAKIEQQEGAK